MSRNSRVTCLAFLAFVMCVACDLKFDSSTNRTLDGERTTLLSTSGEIRFPSWSPDGKTILYSVVSRNSRFVFLNRETNQDSTFLKLNFQIANYDFSPTGTELVYQKEDSLFRYDIPMERHEYLHSALGARRLRWSPDGQKVGISNNNQLFLYDLPSGSLTTLEQHTGPIHEHFSWASDSRRVVFAEALNDIMAIKIWDVAIDSVRSLVEDGSRNYFPDWAPDGSAITFIRQELIEGVALTPKLFVINPNSSEISGLIDTGPIREAIWSADGSLLLIRQGESFSIHLPDGRLVESTNINTDARWHHREKTLITMKPENISEVLAAAYPEMSVFRLSEGTLRARSAWLPDGRTAIIADGNRSLKRMNVVTGGSSFLTDRFNRQITATDFSITSDGKWIAYNSERSLVIVRLAEDGTEGTETLLSARYETPSWNPQGTALICRNADSNGFTIIEITDGLPTKFTDVPNTGGVRNPIWSPDNRELGSRIASQAGNVIVILNPDGSDRRTVVENAVLAGWSPDGRQLLYIRNHTLQVAHTSGSFE